jgi:hypothetical protein
MLILTALFLLSRHVKPASRIETELVSLNSQMPNFQAHPTDPGVVIVTCSVDNFPNNPRNSLGQALCRQPADMK